MKCHKIKSAAELLSGYKILRREVECKSEKASELRASLYAPGTVRLHAVKSKNGEFPMDRISDQVCELSCLEEEIVLLRREARDIEEMVSSLPPLERRIIWLYYVERHPWLMISREVGYGERHCRYIRDRAVSLLDGALISRERGRRKKTG